MTAPCPEDHMTASLAYDPIRMTGFRLDQLAAAFDRVRDPRDWKAPIRAVIQEDQRPVVEQAIRWFTDTEPLFIGGPADASELVVLAPGYRHGPTGLPLGPTGLPLDHARAG
jgi:hypothetical protein